jgi:hypothetical protein
VRPDENDSWPEFDTAAAERVVIICSEGESDEATVPSVV